MLLYKKLLLMTFGTTLIFTCNAALAFPDFAFTSLDKTNLLVYTTMLSNHSNAHSLPIYPICSLPVTDITIPFFLP
jgi:hypothetical protein